MERNTSWEECTTSPKHPRKRNSKGNYRESREHEKPQEKQAQDPTGCEYLSPCDLCILSSALPRFVYRTLSPHTAECDCIWTEDYLRLLKKVLMQPVCYHCTKIGWGQRETGECARVHARPQPSLTHLFACTCACAQQERRRQRQKDGEGEKT